MYSGKKEFLTPAQQAAQDERAEEDRMRGEYEATQHTNLPLDGFMTRLIAEELPILDSTSRQRVHQILREYADSEAPVITSQEELPAEIREIMDL